MGKQLSENEWCSRVSNISNFQIEIIPNSFEKRPVGLQGQKKLYATYVCKKCGTQWTADINAVVKGHGCPTCAIEIGVKNRANTMISKYGSANCLDVPEIREKIIQSRKNTCLKKFKVPNYSQTEEFKNRRKNTNLEKYGVEYPFISKESLEKSKETKIKKYGTAYPQQNNSCREKTKRTLQEKYGVNNPMQVPDFYKKHQRKFTYKNLLFDSSWELAYYIFHEDNNILLNREPETNFWYEDDKGEKHRYIPDFSFPNGTFIEIKGEYWWKKASNSYKNLVQEKSILLTSSAVKPYLTYCENKFNSKKWYQQFKNKKDTSKTEISTPEFSEKLCLQSFSIFQSSSFPYDVYSEDDMRKEYQQILEGKNLNFSKIIKYYHPSIYSAHKKYAKSPIEYWNFLKTSYENYKKLYINRLKYSSMLSGKEFRESGIMSAKLLKDALSVTRTASSISYFKPSFSKHLIETYLNDAQEIFDPFSGFSGRLLGAKALGKKYIGQDINEDHVRESNEIIKFFNFNDCSIIQKDVLESSGKYECLFTCPPYGGKEHWNIQDNEIEKSCDEWIDECLNRFDCKKYLFVVDKTEKYKNYIVETITNRSHFGTNKEYVILIRK